MKSRLVIGLAALVVAFAVSVSALGRGTEGGSGGSVAGYFLTGQLLVAAPKMGDPRFARTVIFMVEHDAGGAMGLVVNRPFGSGPLAEFLRGLGIDNAGVNGQLLLHYGGPVEPGRGFVLHSTDYSGSGTKTVGRGFSLSTQMEVFQAIAEGRGPKRFLVALGYAGWAAGQLESELARDDWLSAPADEDLVFGEDAEAKWERAMARAGINL